MLNSRNLFFIVAVLCISYCSLDAQARPDMVWPSDEASGCPLNEVRKMSYRDKDQWCDPLSRDIDLMIKLFGSLCKCIPGLLRHSNGECVIPRNCKIDEVCPSFEEMNINNILEPTCDGATKKTRKRQSRCVCIKGYFRHPDGYCTNSKNECDARNRE